MTREQNKVKVVIFAVCTQFHEVRHRDEVAECLTSVSHRQKLPLSIQRGFFGKNQPTKFGLGGIFAVGIIPPFPFGARYGAWVC